MIEMVISPTIFCHGKKIGLFFKFLVGVECFFLFLRGWKFAKNMSLKMDLTFWMMFFFFQTPLSKVMWIFSTSCGGRNHGKKTLQTLSIPLDPKNMKMKVLSPQNMGYKS